MDQEFWWSFPSFSLAKGGSYSTRTGEAVLNKHLQLLAVDARESGEECVTVFTDQALVDDFIESVPSTKCLRLRIGDREEIISFLQHAMRTHEHILVDPNPRIGRAAHQPIQELLRNFEDPLGDFDQTL